MICRQLMTMNEWMNKRMETIKTMKYPRRKQEDRVEFFFFCFLYIDHRRWIRLWPCHALSKHTFSLACFPFLLLITLQKSVCYFEKHFVDVKQHFFQTKTNYFFSRRVKTAYQPTTINSFSYLKIFVTNLATVDRL